MSVEEIDNILKKVSAYWTIEENDVGRELLVIPADRKQVCQAVHSLIYGKDVLGKCKRCGYEQERLTEGYCNQCAMDKGLMNNPLADGH